MEPSRYVSSSLNTTHGHVIPQGYTQSSLRNSTVSSQLSTHCYDVAGVQDVSLQGLYQPLTSHYTSSKELDWDNTLQDLHQPLMGPISFEDSDWNTFLQNIPSQQTDATGDQKDVFSLDVESQVLVDNFSAHIPTQTCATHLSQDSLELLQHNNVTKEKLVAKKSKKKSSYGTLSAALQLYRQRSYPLPVLAVVKFILGLSPNFK